MQVALEFRPYSNIPDVAAAANIVAEADRANGGLCVDTWHFFRAHSAYAPTLGDAG
jgi:sugar phosphate isomerase/epimerase